MEDISEVIAEEQTATTDGGNEDRMEKVVATTPEKLSAKEMTFKTTGLLGIALLALTACGGDEEASEETPEAEQADTGDDTGAATEPTDDPTEDETPDAPDIAEIEEAMWEASLGQETVTISAEVPTDSVGAASEDADAASGTMQIGISGDMEGDGYTYTINETLGDYLVFIDQSFQSVNSVVEEYEEVQVEGQGPTPDELREELEPEGEWVDMTSLGVQLETPRQFIENFRSGLLSSAGLEDLSEWDADAETDTHEGEDVWVYSSENEGATVELLVLADEDEPLLMQVNSEAEGQATVVTFSDWNEVEDVERPEDDAVISEDDLLSLVEGMS